MVEAIVITKVMCEILTVAVCFCTCVVAAAGDAVEVRYNAEIGHQTQERHMDPSKVNMQSWHHSAYPNGTFCYPLSQYVFLF